MATPNIDQLDQNATRLETQANEFASGAQTLPDQLRAAVAERFQSSPIAGQRDAALKTYIEQPDQTRSYLASLVGSPGGPVLSPSQQAAISSSRAASATVPLVSLNDLLKAQFGTMGDIVNAGTNAYNAKGQLIAGQAKQARQTADTAFDRLMKEKQYNLDVQKANLDGDGGLSIAQRIALFNALKPSSGQEDGAIAAQSGLSDLQKMKALLFGDAGVSGGNQGAQKYTKQGRSALDWNALGIFGSLNSNARDYRQVATNAYDILSRTRTGAALNLSEEEFYKQFVPGKLDTPQQAQDKIARLENIYQQEVNLGRNPLEILMGENPLESLMGESEWEVISP